MTEAPSVSVIVPVYNAEQYLQKAIESILTQSLSNIEIICVNDGSTDSSKKILSKYKSEDKRIRVIDKPNGGYGKAMNIGIDAARGAYIGIVEPDDYIKPAMYETLYREAHKNDLDFIRSDYYRLTTDSDGVEHLQLVHASDNKAYYGPVLNPQNNLDLFNIKMENWTGIYKRSWLNNNSIRFNESPGASFQDNGFWFQTYCLAERIKLCNQAFYCYRVDNASSSINQTNKAFAMLDEYSWIEQWLRRNPALVGKFLGIFFYKKTHNCMFAFDRLAERYQLPYLERYAAEYNEAFQNKEIDESFFWPIELKMLKAIVSNPESYLQKYREGRADTLQLAAAKERGKVATFAFYAKKEGFISAFKHFLRFVAHTK